MTVRQVLDQVVAALHAARSALDELERGGNTVGQLANLRQVVIESRRSTFVIQKLRSRVVGWDDWWAPHQESMRADPLMRYFHDLRTSIEKEGLPAAMAEIYEVATGETLADVACGEDQFGIWVSGAVRPGGVLNSRLTPGQPLDSAFVALRNFRLPDPPREHDGAELTDFRFEVLAELVITYLAERVVRPAVATFGNCVAE